MSKNLYIFLIVFLGLTAASGILSSIINFQLGPEIYTLDSFLVWFLVVEVTAITGSILLLKYYHQHKFRAAFFGVLIATIANIGYAVVFSTILSSGGLRSYYVPAIMVDLCAVTIYSATLVFSETRKRHWLKLAGICGLVIGLILVSAVVIQMNTTDTRVNAIVAQLGRWNPIAWSLVNVLFIMNFVAEIRTLKSSDATAPKEKPLDGIFSLLTVAAILFTVVIGTLLGRETYSKLYWRSFNAEKAQQMVKMAGGAKTFVGSKGHSLHYILIKPLNYDPKQTYPLVVSLPYGGYEASAAEALSTDANRKTYPAFIFVPYCPDGEGWGGIPGYPSLDSLVYETLTALNEPGIDVKRRYVTGLSRGAYGTWQFICTRPDMFAAALPVSGAGNPKLASKVVDIPIWAFHGAKDKNVPVSGSRDMIAAIKKAGGHPEYTEYPEEGHNIWEKVNDTPGLWNWLFAQKQK